MKIDNQATSIFTDGYAGPGVEQMAKGRNRAVSEFSTNDNVLASGDTVSVSQDAILLTEAMRTAQNTPDVRAEKVVSLRAQVANGTYQMDSRLIAQNLIREEPGLFKI
ncbi:MAG: flagellar biosynthesis anti-sigma factor FlgM [Desulfovibrio sp.]|jgi:negative regulator of flagellin synthesis FlgM|nr:flagellar biosynthesis anti-sigma factor FlgM [Desulfovibrio sp.]